MALAAAVVAVGAAVTVMRLDVTAGCGRDWAPSPFSWQQGSRHRRLSLNYLCADYDTERARCDDERARRRRARQNWVTQPTEIPTVPASDVEGRMLRRDTALLANTLAQPAQSIAHIKPGWVWERLVH